MTAEIFYMNSGLASEEQLYAELMAAYDAHRALGTRVSRDKAVQALTQLRALQASSRPLGRDGSDHTSDPVRRDRTHRREGHASLPAQ